LVSELQEGYERPCTAVIDNVLLFKRFEFAFQQLATLARHAFCLCYVRGLSDFQLAKFRMACHLLDLVARVLCVGEGSRLWKSGRKDPAVVSTTLESCFYPRLSALQIQPPDPSCQVQTIFSPTAGIGPGRREFTGEGELTKVSHHVAFATIVSCCVLQDVDAVGCPLRFHALCFHCSKAVK
jgi:hypothetical protein